MKTVFLVIFGLLSGLSVADDAAFVAAVRAAEAKAIAAYPDSVVKGSELQKEMLAIQAWLEHRKDPVLKEADVGLRITRMAAVKLGIQARKPEGQPASNPVAAPIPVVPAPVTSAADEALRKKQEDQRREHMEYLRQEELKREIRKNR